MASHGVPRPTAVEPKSEKARQKELLEIKEYKDLVDRVTHLINKKEFTEDTLVLTSKLLTKNPEYYTIWNHRRRTLDHLITQKTAEVNEDDSIRYAQNLISSDLDFLLPLLKKFPKCYWIWNHRLWLLQQTSVHLPQQDAQQFWQHELNLVAEMLRRDSRNYHGWGYRRRVISALRTFEDPAPANTAPKPDQTSAAANPAASPDETLTEREFAYTTKMVRANLSNFSAWHNRSKLLPRLLAERNADAAARRRLFDAELTFAADALSMDPNDTSLWFYHQFLMSGLALGGEACFFGPFSAHDRAACLRGQVELFREVLDDWPDCKLIYQNLLAFVDMYAAIGSSEESRDGALLPPLVSAGDMRAWLARLQELDPLRAGRWSDLERRLNL